ncbi:MAG TPA: hypothetical protein VHX13_07005 [Acidobacteriaceae bacterium]|jgi:uncharacterized membrane protein YjdF|nr:hypothetical protein [Acidobacteriaceae bacterium]
MSAIHFYRRYDTDGRCKVICMQCFQTLGTAWDRHSVEAMEAAHICAFWTEGAPATDPRSGAHSPLAQAPLVRKLLQMPAGLLALLTVLVAYAVPTALELAARHTLSPWLAVILPGDLIGCAVLARVLHRPRTAVLLYLLLTTMEGLSYVGGVARGRQLIWFADLVPTLLVLALMVRMKRRNRELAAS